MGVTAIIPCFNGEAFLAEAIESVLRQTRPVDEVIVVDDSSTDGGVKVARQYPVSLLTTQRNLGHAAARNIGIAAAKHELIAWLDADDSWDPDHIDVVAGLLDRNLDAVTAYSAVRLVGARRGTWYSGVEGLDEKAVFLKCVRSTIVPAMSAVTRREPLLAVGGFDESFRTAPDYPLWLKMARKGRFVSTSRVTANYRWHASQISANPIKQMESIRRAREEMIDELRRDGDSKAVADVVREIRGAQDQLLASAWGGHNRRQLRSLLRMSVSLPGNPSELETHLRRRMAIPGWPGGVWPMIGEVVQWLGGRRQ